MCLFRGLDLLPSKIPSCTPETLYTARIKSELLVSLDLELFLLVAQVIDFGFQAPAGKSR